MVVALDAEGIGNVLAPSAGGGLTALGADAVDLLHTSGPRFASGPSRRLLVSAWGGSVISHPWRGLWAAAGIAVPSVQPGRF